MNLCYIKNMGATFIYHGSYTEVSSPKILPQKRTKDFGQGFYCTVLEEQAERWSKKFDTPIVNEYSFLPDTSLDILEFKTMTDEWLDFVVDCRSGKSHNYDIVIGAMADDQIYNYVADFLDGTITREQFWVLAKFKYPTHQICFCTEKSLSCIKFIKSRSVEK